MRKLQGLFVSLLCCLSLCAITSPAQSKTQILVVYYSREGHTRAMAEAVARGARSVENVDVRLLTITQTKSDDLLKAAAIIVGSPVYNANVAPEVVSFISSWPFDGEPLKDKIGAAFVTGGGISAGEELAQLNILHSMMIFGMIVVGGPDWKSAFGASAITDESPFDSAGAGAPVAPHFLLKGERLGKRVAELSLKLRGSR